MRSTLSAITFLALSAASFGQQPANTPYLDPSLSPVPIGNIELDDNMEFASP